MKVQDLQKIAEELVADYCKEYKLKPISIKAKDIKVGRSRWRTRFISIPLWTYRAGGIRYFKAYVIHEIVHFIRHDLFSDAKGSHSHKFRDMEITLLREHNMVPFEYKKAYYKRLEDIKGNLIWLWGTKERRELGLKDNVIEKIGLRY